MKASRRQRLARRTQQRERQRQAPGATSEEDNEHVARRTGVGDA